MRRIHITLQGKGGVGKSFVAALLAQGYLRAGRGAEVVLLDTDPVNATFESYRGLGATRLEILRGDEVDQETFDGLLNRILTEDRDFVVDVGSSGFLPLLSYLLQMGAIETIAESGRGVIVHTVLNAGGALADTLTGFDALARQLPACADLVVWLNEHVGPITSASGRPFEEFPVFLEHKDRVSAVVRIPAPRSPMFARSMATLIEAKETFQEATERLVDDPAKRLRLAQLARPIFAQVERVI